MSAIHVDAPGPLRVDCQSHLYVPELLARMARRRTEPRVYREGSDTVVVVGEWHRRVFPHHSDVGVKLAAMDAAGIHMTALSINDPGPERFGAEGPEFARIANDFIADVVRQHPRR